MKRFSLLIIVLLALSIIGTAAAETTYFTCDSDPADFNGKTFDDLYVLLNGCTNLDSTVLPGEDAFVTLKDITVNGFLYYTDDTVDESGTLLREPVNSNNTTADHYLNITGKSLVRNAIMECRNAHDCNIGINRDSYIVNIYLQPTENKSRGKMVLRGAIDGLVDENTDYYADTAVASYPDFDLDKMDFEHHKGLKNWHNFFELNGDNPAFDGAEGPFNRYSYIANGPYDEPFEEFRALNELDITAEEYLKTGRGYYGRIVINNQEKLSPGQVEVELANVRAYGIFVNNLAYENYEDHAEVMATGTNFVPEIYSKGYTEVSLLIATSDLKTDIRYPENYVYHRNDHQPEFETAVLPFYIDVTYLGSHGTTLKYLMDHTRISGMAYMGDEVPGSTLYLRTESNEENYYFHYQEVNENAGYVDETGHFGRINTLLIFGGVLDFSNKYLPMNPVIAQLDLYEGKHRNIRLVDLYEEPTLNALKLDESEFGRVTAERISEKEDGCVSIRCPKIKMLDPEYNLNYTYGSFQSIIQNASLKTYEYMKDHEVACDYAETNDPMTMEGNRYVTQRMIQCSPHTGLGVAWQYSFYAKRYIEDTLGGKASVTRLKGSNVSIGRIGVSKYLGGKDNFWNIASTSCRFTGIPGSKLPVLYTISHEED